MGQTNRLISKVFSALLDAMLNFTSICVSFFIIMPLENLGAGVSVGSIGLAIIVAISVFTIVIYSFCDLYSTSIFVKLHIQLIRYGIANVVLLALAVSVLAIIDMPQGYYFIAIIAGAISTIAIFLKKIIATKAVHEIRKRSPKTKKVIIFGSGKSAQEYEKQVRENSHYGINILGCITDEESPEFAEKLGNYCELDRLLKEYNPHELVIAVKHEDKDRIASIIDICDKNGVRTAIIPFTYDYFKSKCQVDMIGTMPVINTRTTPLDRISNALIKRIMDIVISLLLIILTSPIMLIAAIGVGLSSRGPIIFKQKRVGKNNEEFTMYKFRSMKVNEMSDSAWTTNEDPRKTRFGTFMRKTGIDELPQLFNVLFGTMSIVGPRPELPKFVEEYSKTIPLYKVKHQVKPGITGLAQIYGFRGDTSIERRIELDIKYIEEWSAFNDLKIILMTPFKMFNRNEKYVK